MAWYWWIVAVILAINFAFVALVGLALVFSKLRKRRARMAEAAAQADQVVGPAGAAATDAQTGNQIKLN
jgi:TRAP-type mannitol/chloroaromatic compound transport system permease small subunit